jgi:hypothetical protein
VNPRDQYRWKKGGIQEKETMGSNGSQQTPLSASTVTNTRPVSNQCTQSDWQQAILPRDRNLSPSRSKDFVFSILSRTVLEHPFSWVLVSLSLGIKLPGHDTTRLQLVLRSRKLGSIHLLPHTPSWCSAELDKHRDNFILH